MDQLLGGWTSLQSAPLSMFPRYGVVKGKGPTANRDMVALYERTPPRDLHGWTEMMLGQNRVRVLGVHGGCGCGGGGRISPRAESPKNDARSVVALVGSDGLSLLSGDYGLTTFAIRPYSTRHSTQHQQAHAIVIASRTIGSSLGRLAISPSPLSSRLPRPSHGFRILQRRLRVAEQPMQ